ncbi:NST UDP-N-acetylglucosamine transporter [Colletotrichum higginsianum]|uniref:NST UDP-N-acetylglucosamine transporter n=1 Tax=Colletotrichum higginsianum (strain IMI 349063) TaxID=759273 RepID=H1W213_COLHI|nr:NST UDP-N-acetylglucosamine transporter [Colletotrichum higginsianum]
MTSSAPTRRRGQPKGISSLSSEKMEPAPRGDDDEKNITDNANGSAMNGHPSTEKPMQIAGRIVTSLFAQWIAVGVMLGLIFGGCCSNVYALEAIIKSVRIVPHLVVICSPNFTSLESNPRAFLFVAITGYFSQFDGSRPPFFIRENKVPLRRWIINIVLFFSINVLNNHAFSYDISVPVHIILRSGGSITTMIAGTLYGKNVVGRTIQGKPQYKDSSKSAEKSDRPAFGTGLIILFVAQVLSAIMGLYTEETYKKYGPQWRENLFYSHLLSLPLFLPFAPSLIRQFRRLADSPPLSLPLLAQLAGPGFGEDVGGGMAKFRIPSQLAYLATNVLTQYACIRGVNLLAAVSSALTVTIVLNIRKLVSLLLSIWLFGNRLAVGTLVGAIIVFGAGGLYSLDSRAKTSRVQKGSNTK